MLSEWPKARCPPWDTQVLRPLVAYISERLVVLVVTRRNVQYIYIYSKYIYLYPGSPLPPIFYRLVWDFHHIIQKKNQHLEKIVDLQGIFMYTYISALGQIGEMTLFQKVAFCVFQKELGPMWVFFYVVFLPTWSGPTNWEHGITVDMPEN